MITTERTVKEDGSFVETSTQEQSSVVIKRNAKGEFAWDLKIYNDDPEEFEKTAESFLQKIGTTIDKAKDLQL
jgi:hypothetical protein